jgi:serine/threonine-protein kinase HipA
VTDYRSLETLHVFREDKRVGTLTRLPNGCEFTYEADVLQSNDLPLALHLPKTSKPLVTEGILNLPTYFAGLLPEGVMLAAAQTLLGSAKDDLFAVLAATGRDAVGDVEVRTPGAPRAEPSLLNLAGAKEVIASILEQKGGRVDAIAAIPGVQPKMSIGSIVRASKGPSFIAKFPPLEFVGLVENEAACMTLAKRCGLRVTNVRVDQGVLIVERFDRESTGKGRFRKVHVEDMLQVMNLFPHSKYGLDFVELSAAMESLNVSVAGILEILRLYAFSYMVGNGDLHAKNVSLIRKPDGRWVPSPAYDIVSTLPYGNVIAGADAMALALADEALGRFEMGDFIEFGLRFGIPERATRKAVTSLARSAHRLARDLLTGPLPTEHLDVVLSRVESLLE